jgi:holin-like protein
MKYVRQMGLILFMAFIGEVLNKVVGIPLPGSVLGLLLLLGFLLTGIVKLTQVEEVSGFLLSHLTLFFVPAGVGLMTVSGALAKDWLVLLLLSIVTTLLVLTVTALTVKALRRKTA